MSCNITFVRLINVHNGKVFDAKSYESLQLDCFLSIYLFCVSFFFEFVFHLILYSWHSTTKICFFLGTQCHVLLYNILLCYILSSTIQQQSKYNSIMLTITTTTTTTTLSYSLSLAFFLVLCLPFPVIFSFLFCFLVFLFLFVFSFLLFNVNYIESKENHTQ